MSSIPSQLRQAIVQLDALKLYEEKKNIPRLMSRVAGFMRELGFLLLEGVNEPLQFSEKEKRILQKARPYLVEYYVDDVDRQLGYIDNDPDLWESLCIERTNIEAANVLLKGIISPLDTEQIDWGIRHRSKENHLKRLNFAPPESHWWWALSPPLYLNDAYVDPE